MVTDPHRVLGVSPGAGEDEIKKAYRKKAKECHPDLHPDDPHATEKMNEVNEAYDMLMHPEKYRGQPQQGANPWQQAGGYQRQNGPYYGGFNPYGSNPFGSWGWVDLDDLFGGAARQSSPVPPPEEMNYDPMEIRVAVQAIKAGRWQEAMNCLSRVPARDRNGRWHYLCALAQHGAGNTMTALEEIQRAVQMEPGNPTYQQLLRQYQSAGQTYTQRARGYNMSAADPSRWCMRICLANLLCNLFCRCM